MITYKQLFGVAIVCSLLLPTQASATELANNPFARPPSERSGPSPAVRGEQNGPVQVLLLQATMVGTRGRFANVGGRVLQPGDEIQGYTLLRVYEDRAVFSRQGKQETIFVKPDPVENDE